MDTNDLVEADMVRFLLSGTEDYNRCALALIEQHSVKHAFGEGRSKVRALLCTKTGTLAPGGQP